MRILYPRCLFFHVSYMLHYMLFCSFFAILTVLDGGSRRLGTTKGGCHYFVTPHDLHTNLEFEDIVLSVLDRLCLVPYVSPSPYYGHVQYHFLRDKAKRSTSGG